MEWTLLILNSFNKLTKFELQGLYACSFKFYEVTADEGLSINIYNECVFLESLYLNNNTLSLKS